MTLKDQEIFIESQFQRMKDTMLKKGNDYAGEDRLSNFKLGGAIIGLDARVQCLALISTKIARLGQLFTGKKPNNESIDDNILDLACYSLLLAMLQHESV